TLPPLTSFTLSMKRKDEEENTGTLFCFAKSNICLASLYEAAIGLSINKVFLALITGMACSKCTLPSLLSNNTTSTFFNSALISLTISTPYFFTSSMYFGTRSTEDGISLLPCATAATTLYPLNLGSGFSPFKDLVNAVACDVSNPIIPTRFPFCTEERPSKNLVFGPSMPIPSEAIAVVFMKPLLLTSFFIAI